MCRQCATVLRSKTFWHAHTWKMFLPGRTSTVVCGRDSRASPACKAGSRGCQGRYLRAGLSAAGGHHLFCPDRTSGGAVPDLTERPALEYEGNQTISLLLRRSGSIRSHMGDRIIIDPVTRIEGHSRSAFIWMIGKCLRRPFPCYPVQGGLKNSAKAGRSRDACPHGEDLRHLP